MKRRESVLLRAISSAADSEPVCSSFQLSSEDNFCKWMEIVKACIFRYYATFNAVRTVSTICHHWENGNITITSVFIGLKHDIRGSLHFLSGFRAGILFPPLLQFASVSEIMRATVFHVPFSREHCSLADSLK